MNNKHDIVVDKDYAAFIDALPKELSSKLSFRDLRLIRRALPDGWTGAKRIAELEAEVERLSNPWIPIGDIPKEWKDGRSVDLWVISTDESYRLCGARYKPANRPDGYSGWKTWNFRPREESIAYAMLTPKEPTP